MKYKKVIPLADYSTYARLRTLAAQPASLIAERLMVEDLHIHDSMARRMTLCCVANALSEEIAASKLLERIPEVRGFLLSTVGDPWRVEADFNLTAHDLQREQRR